MTCNTAVAVPEVSPIILPGVITGEQIATNPQIVLFTSGQERIRVFGGTTTANQTEIITTDTFTGCTVSNPTTGGTIYRTDGGTGIWTVANNTIVQYRAFTSSTTTNSYFNVGTTQGVVFWNSARYDQAEYVAYQAQQKRKYERDRRVSIHKAKSSIKKALKLIDNMGFGDEIRVFIGGDEIVIDNPQSIFKFVLKRGQSIIEKTINPGYSTPYKLELLTKDDIHVSNLCVYLKDTPVLDQILAVALYIKTGNEEDVLEKANWFGITRDEGVKQLVYDYNPNLARKIGYRLEQEPRSGIYVADFTGYIQSNGDIAVPA